MGANEVRTIELFLAAIQMVPASTRAGFFVSPIQQPQKSGAGVRIPAKCFIPNTEMVTWALTKDSCTKDSCTSQ